MSKSKLLQIILLFSGIIIFIITYNSFFQTKKIVEKNIVKNLNEKIDENIDKKTSNLIENLSYETVDYNGNIFRINAKITKTFIDKDNINYMEIIFAKIFLVDGRIIEITSDKAIYDTLNYNTNFSGNVVVTENQNKIKSENLDFFFDDNLIKIYNNVEYYGYNKFLIADRVDINLSNKEAEIYMINKSDRVTINIKN